MKNCKNFLILIVLMLTVLSGCAKHTVGQILTPPFPIDTVASNDYVSMAGYVNQPDKYVLLARTSDQDYLVYERPQQEKQSLRKAKIKRKNTQEINTEQGGTTIYVGKGGKVDYNFQSPETEAPEKVRSKHIQKSSSNGGFVWVSIVAVVVGALLVFLYFKFKIKKPL